jgi:PhoD-like phosphatase
MRIVACSCADYRTAGSYDVWTRIRAENPDLLLLLGDNVYLPQSVNPSDANQLRANLTLQYQRLLGDPPFRELLAYMQSGGRRVAAIYDDHDSIGEDMNHPVMSPSMRSVVQEVFFQHLGFAASPPNIYQSFDVDLARIVMLDARSYRIHNAETLEEVLGAAQAAWFRAQIAATSGKPYLLVCSGITLHRYSPPPLVSSGWFFHQEARRELTALLAGKPGVLFLSGDIHRNALKMKGGVIELVSSGVARKQIFGSKQLRNYAVLDFSVSQAIVQFRALRSEDESSRTIALAKWRA